MTAKTKPKFTIAGLDPEAKAAEGIEFEIVDPTTCTVNEDGSLNYSTGDGTGMHITVIGRQSATFKAETRKQINSQRQAEFKARSTGKPVPPTTIEEDIAKSVEIVSACTIGWRGVVIDEDEGELEFTPENVRRLYSYDFIRLQADAAVMGVTGFTSG